uniref:C2H2-type domain-containing protein n=1 Tax=Anopheles minimus TaxID=112268 RepID=A0A182VV42_9DIPT
MELISKDGGGYYDGGPLQICHRPPLAHHQPTTQREGGWSSHLTNLSGPAATHSSRGSTGHLPPPPGSHLQQLHGSGVLTDHTKLQYLGNMQVHPAHSGSGGHHPPPPPTQGPPQSAHPPPPQPIPIVKPEFKVPPIPAHLMDVRGPDGSLVKINMPEHHDPSKPPNNVEMLKVNIEDLSQFLSYHEVFGKLPSDMLTGPSASLVPSSSTNTATTSAHSNDCTQAKHPTSALTAGRSLREKNTLPIMLHTGETPFQCSYCQKKFTRKEHLTNHVRLHTGETPFQCSYCQKKFTRKEHLTYHVRLHTGETPFQCSYCQKKFTRKEHLTNHVR